MTRTPARLVADVLLGLSLVCGPAAAEDHALTVADLAAYRAALAPPRGTPEPPAVVDFRALWSHPATYQGRRVQVEGRLARRFRQASFGTFPPLEEAWVFSSRGDPFCLVFPEGPETDKASRTTTVSPVRFTGTFLKLLEYQGGDGRRLAPLIVGPSPPVLAAPDQHSAPAPAVERPSRPLDWMVGLALALLVVVVLVYQHVRPLRAPLALKEPLGPEPTFDDGPAPGPGGPASDRGRNACPD
jgi:hypothetical protein